MTAGGLAGRVWLPGFFKVWGRFEMGLLAEFQFYAYRAGMLLASTPSPIRRPLSLFAPRKVRFFAERKTTLPADPSPDVFEGKETRRFGCLMWLIGMAVLSCLVLDSLPP